MKKRGKQRFTVGFRPDPVSNPTKEESACPFDSALLKSFHCWVESHWMTGKAFMQVWTSSSSTYLVVTNLGECFPTELSRKIAVRGRWEHLIKGAPSSVLGNTQPAKFAQKSPCRPPFVDESKTKPFISGVACPNFSFRTSDRIKTWLRRRGAAIWIHVCGFRQALIATEMKSYLERHAVTGSSSAVMNTAPSCSALMPLVCLLLRLDKKRKEKERNFLFVCWVQIPRGIHVLMQQTPWHVDSVITQTGWKS